MTNTPSLRWARPVLLGLGAIALATSAAAGDTPALFKATASVTTPGGTSITSPVVVSIERWTSDADRDRALAALTSGGSAAFHKVVAALPESGFLQVGAVKTPLHYARSLPVSGGAVITAVTIKPVLHLGAGAADAKPKAGYDMAVATFQIDADGNGTFGEFQPAARVKVNDKGTIIVEDYAVPTIALSGISRSK